MEALRHIVSGQKQQGDEAGRIAGEVAEVMEISGGRRRKRSMEAGRGWGLSQRPGVRELPANDKPTFSGRSRKMLQRAKPLFLQYNLTCIQSPVQKLG
jgi:hypothetical protein